MKIIDQILSTIHKTTAESECLPDSIWDSIPDIQVESSNLININDTWDDLLRKYWSMLTNVMREFQQGIFRFDIDWETDIENKCISLIHVIALFLSISPLNSQLSIIIKEFTTGFFSLEAEFVRAVHKHELGNHVVNFFR